jgi:carbonic anhydrase/acetyltransferase-like protein (isoleucine patch superfamily)
MSLFEHVGKCPRIDPTAFVAPTATLIGDVSIGAGSVVLFGAVLAAETGPISIGCQCVIMENAVLRGVARHPLVIEDHVLVGPHAHLTGCRVQHEVFVATGACLFNGAVLEPKSTVKIQGIVHVGTRLPAETVVPIGWIAVGDPIEILPPETEPRLTALLREQNFMKTVFGQKERSIKRMAETYSGSLQNYRDLSSVAGGEAI